MTARPAIALEQVYLGWNDRLAVRDLTGVFEHGSKTAIVGPNGAGKSTLIRAVMGQLAPLRGRIRLSPQARDDRVCMPQTGSLDSSFPITVRDLVAMGAWRRVGPWRGYGVDEHARIDRALVQVGLPDFGARFIETLSGGQLQRALFARLIVHDAQVVVLDEPFAAVDSATTADMLVILDQWHAQGRTLIVVLHDLELVHAHFPQTLLLAGQQVAWGPTAQALTDEHLHLARHLCARDFA